MENSSHGNENVEKKGDVSSRQALELTGIIINALTRTLKLPAANSVTIQKIIEKPGQIYNIFTHLIAENEAPIIITEGKTIKIKATNGNKCMSNEFPNNRWMNINGERSLLSDVPQTVLENQLFYNVNNQNGVGCEVETLFYYLDPNLIRLGLNKQSIPTPEIIIDIAKFSGGPILSLSKISGYSLGDLALTTAQIIEFCFSSYSDLIPNDVPVFVLIKHHNGKYYPLSITRDNVGYSLVVREYNANLFVISESTNAYVLFGRK